MAAGETQVPDGWRMVRLGDMAKINPRRPKLNVEGDTRITFLPMAAIAERMQGIITRELRPYSEISTGYTYFEENDFLFSKITPCLQNGKHTLATGLKLGFGFGTTEFHVVRAGSSLDTRYMFHSLIQPHIIERCAKSFAGTAGQQRVQPETLKILPISLPPLPEQRAIAAVLDGIDDAIEASESVASATEALRDSLLHELLTRGVPGWHADWREARGVGTVPTSWQVVRLGEVAEVNVSNWDPSDGASILYLDLTAVSAPGVLSPPRELSAADAPSRARRRVASGDILVSTVRPNLRGFARVHDAPRNLIASTGFAVVSANGKSDGSFLYHHVMTRRFSDYLTGASTGQAYPAVRASDVSAFTLPLPPLLEQQAIAAMLDSVDGALENHRRETDALRSLKASSSAALLTGRVRV